MVMSLRSRWLWCLFLIGWTGIIAVDSYQRAAYDRACAAYSRETSRLHSRHAEIMKPIDERIAPLNRVYGGLSGAAL